jgi:MFS family permease
MEKDKLWTKNFLFLFLSNSFVSLIFYLLMTTMAVYAVKQYHTSESSAGLAAGIFVIGALVSRLFAGKYIEVIGRRRLLLGGLFFYLIATLCYFLADHLIWLLLIRFLHGAAFGCASTAMQTAVMDMIPHHRKGEGIGYFTLSTTVATAIGPFLGLFISQHADYQMIFEFCALFSFLSLIIAFFAGIPQVSVTEEQLQAMKSGFSFWDFFEKKALPISLYMVLIGITYSSIVSFINSYAIEVNLTESAGFFFIVYAVMLLISRPLAGKLLDLKGENMVLYPAIILHALCFLFLSQARHGSVLLLAGALLALGFGALMSCCQVVAIKESPKHKVGLATSTFYSLVDGGVGVGPYLIGIVIQYMNFRSMYLMLSFLVLLSIFLYFILHGKKAALRKKQQQRSQQAA